MSKREIRPFDLTPLAKQWVVEQFQLFVEDQPERVEKFTFDVRELGDYFADYVHTYLLRHEVPAAADKTATIMRYSRGHMYKKLEK